MSTTPQFESATWYQATNGTGTRITFSAPRTAVGAEVKGGIIWIRPRSVNEVLGANPTNPIPAPGGVALGWHRLQDGDTIDYGTDDPHTTGERTVLPDTIVAVDAWCEATGDLLLVSH